MTKSRNFPFHLELNGSGGKMQLYIADCLYLDHYESSLILLRTKASTLRISGRAMVLTLLDRGGIEIEGMIMEVSLFNAK